MFSQVKLNDVLIDLDKGLVIRPDKIMQLTKEEHGFLQVLLINIDKKGFATYQEICEFVYKQDYYEVVNSLRTLKCRVETKLGRKPSFFVADKSNGAYRLRESVIISFPKETKKYSLNKNYHIEPCSNMYYVNRPEIIKDIDKVFDNQCRVVFISGIGGIGKSEIARKYASISHKSGRFQYVAELDYNQGKVLDLIVEHAEDRIIADIALINIKDVPQIKKDLLYNAKNDTLILIHNFDSADYDFLQDISRNTGDARLIISSRVSTDMVLDGYGVVLHYEQYDNGDNSFQRILFCKYANIEPKKLSARRCVLINHIVEGLQHHSMMIALLGTWVRKKMRYDGISLTDALEKAKQSFSNIKEFFDNVQIVKDYRSNIDTPYGMLKALFSTILKREYQEAERELLGIVAILPSQYCNLTIVHSVLSMLGYDEKQINEATMALLDDGLVNLSAEKNLVIHELLKQLLFDPTINHGGKTIARHPTEGVSSECHYDNYDSVVDTWSLNNLMKIDDPAERFIEIFLRADSCIHDLRNSVDDAIRFLYSIKAIYDYIRQTALIDKINCDYIEYEIANHLLNCNMGEDAYKVLSGVDPHNVCNDQEKWNEWEIAWGKALLAHGELDIAKINLVNALKNYMHSYKQLDHPQRTEIQDSKPFSEGYECAQVLDEDFAQNMFESEQLLYEIQTIRLVLPITDCLLAISSLELKRERFKTVDKLLKFTERFVQYCLSRVHNENLLFQASIDILSLRAEYFYATNNYDAANNLLANTVQLITEHPSLMYGKKELQTLFVKQEQYSN